jgi:hypothetical protein
MDVGTLGLTALGRVVGDAFRRECPTCKHPISLHEGARVHIMNPAAPSVIVTGAHQHVPTRPNGLTAAEFWLLFTLALVMAALGVIAWSPVGAGLIAGALAIALYMGVKAARGVGGSGSGVAQPYVAPPAPTTTAAPTPNVTVVERVVERVIERQVVMTRCRSCGALSAEGVAACSACGANV